MTNNTGDNQTQGGAFSIKRLFLYLFPILAAAMALVSGLLMLLARLGAFGAVIKELIVSRGFFTNPLAILLYIVILSSAGLAALVAYVMERMSVHRREMVIKAIDDVRRGDFAGADNKRLYDADRSSFHRLEEISNAMLGMEEQTKIYARDASAAQADKEQLMFNLLAEKASPAMLKRVMKAFEMLAENGRTEETLKVSQLLSEVISSILADSTKPVLISSELSLIRTFLDMDEIVSGERILLRPSIMCNITDYKLLPNIILPVVANFVEYARKGNRIGKYEISLELSNIKNHVLLILRDNGTGIEGEALKKLREELETDEVDMLEDVVTLPNINKRIKLYYGNDCGVKVSSSRLGTVVKIYLPIQTEENK